MKGRKKIMKNKMPDYEEKIRKTIKWKSKIKDEGISNKKKNWGE